MCVCVKYNINTINKSQSTEYLLQLKPEAQLCLIYCVYAHPLVHIYTAHTCIRINSVHKNERLLYCTCTLIILTAN